MTGLTKVKHFFQTSEVLQDAIASHASAVGVEVGFAVGKSQTAQTGKD